MRIFKNIITRNCVKWLLIIGVRGSAKNVGCPLSVSKKWSMAGWSNGG